MADGVNQAAAGGEMISWPYIFTLKKPADALGETIASLTLREPTATDLLDASVFDGDITGAQMLDLIAKLSGKPAAAIRALPGIEMLALVGLLASSFRPAAS